MLELLWVATGVVIVFGAAVAYWQSRDALHPAVILAPPFLYFYCVWPLLLNRNGRLLTFLPESIFVFAATLFLVAILAMYFGLTRRISAPPVVGNQLLGNFIAYVARSPRLQRRLYATAIVIGSVSVLAYTSLFDFSIDRFIRGYSRAKGGGYGDVSGYVGEAMLLGLPAVIILALAIRARGRILARDVLLALVLISPQLLQGTFGGRRGPLFISLAALFFAWCIARGRQPTVRQSIAVISIIGLLMIAVAANRQDVYIGSGKSFDIAAVSEAFSDDIEVSNEYVAGVTYVETRRYFADHYWGYRYFITFFVRPIPRQLWPTKYEDMGAEWIHEFGDASYDSDILAAVGYALPRGVSTGSIADAFGEISWGVVIMFFMLGRVYSGVWYRHRTRGGYWTVLLFMMLALSVYLPSQSFSAWMVRVMFGAAGTIILWRWFFGGGGRTAAVPVLSGRSLSPAPR